MKENLLIKIMNIRSWDDFKRYVRDIQEELQYPFFRGQGNKFREAGVSDCGWRLEPSFIRSPIKSHPSYTQWLETIIQDQDCRAKLKPLLKRSIDINDKNDKLVVTGLLRHLGFPTPLLDWTRNPFKAAYFAFSKIHDSSRKVTIFIFDKKAWQISPYDLTGRGCIVSLKKIEDIIPRQKAQESEYTYCRTSDMFKEIVGDESEGIEYFISYCSLPSYEKKYVLLDLKEMCITEETLFPDKNEIESLKQDLELLYQRYVGT